MYDSDSTKEIQVQDTAEEEDWSSKQLKHIIPCEDDSDNERDGRLNNVCGKGDVSCAEGMPTSKNISI